jgi:hypothetical protein
LSQQGVFVNIFQRIGNNYSTHKLAKEVKNWADRNDSHYAYSDLDALLQKLEANEHMRHKNIKAIYKIAFDDFKISFQKFIQDPDTRNDCPVPPQAEISAKILMRILDDEDFHRKILENHFKETHVEYNLKTISEMAQVCSEKNFTIFVLRKYNSHFETPFDTHEFFLKFVSLQVKILQLQKKHTKESVNSLHEIMHHLFKHTEKQESTHQLFKFILEAIPFFALSYAENVLHPVPKS